MTNIKGDRTQCQHLRLVCFLCFFVDVDYVFMNKIGWNFLGFILYIYSVVSMFWWQGLDTPLILYLICLSFGTKVVWQQANPIRGRCVVKDDPPINLLLFCWCISGLILLLGSLICVFLIKPSLCAAYRSFSCVTVIIFSVLMHKFLGLESNVKLICSCEIGLVWVHTARHPRFLLR